MSTLTLFDDSSLERTPPRVLVMWYPDWPVISAFPGADADDALVVIEKGAVLACSAAARAGGVRRGMRRREAQSRVPSLSWVEHNPDDDARAFEPLLRAIEHISPGVEPIRPGMCATGARGPAGYFGGEEQLIDVLGEYLESLGFPEARFGIADGPFAAIQAARADVVVPPGGSASFLSELPVDRLDLPGLADLLRRTGIRTLAQFASLPANQVSARFGAEGAHAHRLATGLEQRRLAVRTPPPELSVLIDLDPPLDRVDVVAFTMRQHADRFVAQLARHDLVCTALEVRLTDERDAASQRVWRHPRWFTAADVVDRVRWQVQAASPANGAAKLGIDGGGVLLGALSTIELVPRELDRVGEHPDQLYDRGRDDEKVHRAFTRVQSMLDHTAILTPTRSGGRSPREFCTLTPWGESPAPRRDPLAPWPGRLPDPAPSQLLSPPESVIVHGDTGVLTVDDRGFLSEKPTGIRYRDGRREKVTAWAGPWHSDERWWDLAAGRELARIQAVTAKCAYLLVHSSTGWWLEGIYD
ncbi:DNA polymerase Y family protein [Blastococcus sp. Marseille-P5729]|uniref:DNA polymerase Y family protein n=1 Tax=Blastococcus sp. Marseille-P5729 TaxID=2086582 RepID=UPI000D0F5B06|nr:DNA polymerase Y family protein [Blastococcus sp. Marseille-P5729]